MLNRVQTSMTSFVFACMLGLAAVPTAAQSGNGVSLASLSTQPSMNVFRRFAVEPAKMASFYSEVLGLKQLPSLNMPGGGQMMLFEIGSGQVKLQFTPAAGECCKHPGKKCPPTPDAWTHPTWQAIAFELSDPHYYSYELVIEDAGFIARAVGDLDCDGEHGVYELRATAKPDGTFEVALEPTSDAPTE